MGFSYEGEINMNLITLILLSIALAMDAFAVSITNGMVYKSFSKKDAFLSSLSFGIFQGVMPLIGYFLGSVFSGKVEHIAPYIAFALLAFLGTKMIVECLKNKDNEEAKNSAYTIKEILIQSFATSIDAFAVGITFAVMNTNVWLSCGTIAIITFVCCIIACYFGKFLGKLFGKKAELAGGVILIVIGLKILIEYLIKVL